MRNQLIDCLKRELVGPDTLSHRLQENGEEILEISPRERYASGILFPQQTSAEQLSFLQDLMVEQNENDLSGASTEFATTEGNREEIANDEIDTINLANTYMPSAIGFSCIVDENCETLEFVVSAGVYEECKEELSTQTNPKTVYKRNRIEQTFRVSKDKLPEYKVSIQKTALQVCVYKRKGSFHNGTAPYFTFTLVNTNQTDKSISDKNCFYQVSLLVKSALNAPCFLPLPSLGYSSKHEDDESLSFLYRNVRSYAIGHGCSVNWSENEHGCQALWTDTIPHQKVLSIMPAHFEDLRLCMQGFALAFSDRNQLVVIQKLCDKYQAWIDEQDSNAQAIIKETDKSIALHHIGLCKSALERMLQGLKILEEDDLCAKAFSLMNEAVLLQQLHYNLPFRPVHFGKQAAKISYSDCEIGITDVKAIPDPNTLPGKLAHYGEWHPFQLAFILMNIKSFFDPDCDDRKIADLIWFPTGGGKTEAYLGLSAFVLFLRRLRKPDAASTAVIMRYTLRLLTSQQFLRASTLICACELLRQREGNMGNVPITLGLWVGYQSAPNTRDEAIALLRKLSQSQQSDNYFVLLKCPWCGAQMGVIKEGKRNVILGYEHTLNPSTVRYLCPDKKCIFSNSGNYLPLTIIDEDIYDSPPTLLIGTVDKFAMLVWRPEARSLFSIQDDGTKILAPELIIQDEIHLISSTLGSIVGHYETLIFELAMQEREGRRIPPKIVASTATISRAKEQIAALYAKKVDEICVFPPQGLEIGSSFFSEIEKDDPGRIYVGVFPAGLVSKISAQVRLVAALLQGAKDADMSYENDRDPYWTLIEYFGSLRELGIAATLVTSYLSDYLLGIHKRRSHKPGFVQGKYQFRKIKRYIELTSRIAGHKIPTLLQALEQAYPNVDDNQIPVDICLATNMISVGLDVSRLGMMVVVGQPKLTSEYIQTSSRIGRSKSGPGLIVTLYNPYRSRDRSFYEQFHQYHNRLYQYVEPSSVTPFSAPVREKALHALLVGLVRYLGTKRNADFPTPPPALELLDKIRDIICQRVSIAQPDEIEQSLELLDSKIKHWQSQLPAIFGNYLNKEQEHCLIYPAGTSQPKEILARAWPTLMSMRDVDRNCELMILPREYKDVKDE